MHESIELDKLLPQVIAIAQEAAAATLKIYTSNDLHIVQKADGSPLTAADEAANDIIIDGLRRLTPILPIVSEESLKHAEDRLTAQAVWIVDPIDGTKDFIKHTDEFTVNIALVQDGEPVLGVVSVPAKDILYYGAKDLGAFKQIGQDEPVALTKQPPRDEPIVAVSASSMSEETTTWMRERGLTKTLAAGSSLKLCYVADGTVDVFPRLAPQTEWDIAAADAVLRAAGGMVYVHPSGEPMPYNKPDLKTPHYIATLSLAV